MCKEPFGHKTDDIDSVDRRRIIGRIMIHERLVVQHKGKAAVPSAQEALFPYNDSHAGRSNIFLGPAINEGEAIHRDRTAQEIG